MVCAAPSSTSVKVAVASAGAPARNGTPYEVGPELPEDGRRDLRGDLGGVLRGRGERFDDDDFGVAVLRRPAVRGENVEGVLLELVRGLS
jgi:hypothetical protein